jgi:hypothetical protein
MTNMLKLAHHSPQANLTQEQPNITSIPEAKNTPAVPAIAAKPGPAAQ